MTSNLFLVFVVAIGMNQKHQYIHPNNKSLHSFFIETSSSQSTGIEWTESLSEFRKALLNVDIKTVKSFFVFPVMNPGNDIWMVVDMENVTRVSPKKIVPFKESDFDKHFSALFAIDFRKTFEKIDIEKLAKTGQAESPSLTVVSPATSKMRAAFSVSKNTIILSLITKSSAFGQYSIDYHFKILPNGLVRFTHLEFDV